MKVKLFWKNAPVVHGDKNARAFEDEINAWLSEHPRITIIDIGSPAVARPSDRGSFRFGTRTVAPNKPLHLTAAAGRLSGTHSSLSRRGR